MLYDWQQPEADHLTEVLQRSNAALEASDTGVGKTFIAAQVAKNLGRRPLIISPKSVHTPWRETLKLFDVTPLDILNVEKLKTGKTKWVQRKNRGKLFSDWSWHIPTDCLIIWDEAHQAGGVDSQNAKLMALLKTYDIPVLAMSATIADTPLRLRAFGYLLGFHNFRDFDRWCRFYGCYTSPFARGALEFPKGKSRMQYLKRLHKKLFPEFGGRLCIEDLEDFPECSIQADSFDISNCKAIQDVYDELEDKLHDTENEELPIVLLQRARENTEILKTPLLAEQTKDLLEEGKSVVIFLSYRSAASAVLDRIEGQSGSRPGFIYGGQTDRDEVIEAFQSDKNRVLVCMIQAGGVGISLHDLNGNFPRVSLISPPYSIVQLKQALGRVWRAGALTKSLQKIVFAAGTVEDKACTAIKRKLGNLNMLNDGDLTAGISINMEKKDD